MDEYMDRVFVVTVSTDPDTEVGESDIAAAIYRGVEGIDSPDAVEVERQPNSRALPPRA